MHGATLAKSQTWCRRIMYAQARRFYFASRILPRPKRHALEALYAVFRTADDLADEPGIDDAQRRQGLEAVRLGLARVRDPSFTSDAAWFAAAQDAFGRYPIAIADALAVVAGCESELTGAPVTSFEGLERLASIITGGVARCCVAVLGAPDGDSLWCAERIGIALQLTNMLRDEARDRSLGRDYFGFAGARAPQRLDVKRAAARRAREHYALGPQLAARLPNDGSRLTVLLALRLHRAVLDGLERKTLR